MSYREFMSWSIYFSMLAEQASTEGHASRAQRFASEAAYRRGAR